MRGGVEERGWCCRRVVVVLCPSPAWVDRQHSNTRTLAGARARPAPSQEADRQACGCVGAWMPSKGMNALSLVLAALAACYGTYARLSGSAASSEDLKPAGPGRVSHG